MRFDIETGTPVERLRFLYAKIFDSVTGDELTNLSAFDTETGWRREFVQVGPMKYRSFEILGNPMRVEFDTLPEDASQEFRRGFDAQTPEERAALLLGEHPLRTLWTWLRHAYRNRVAHSFGWRWRMLRKRCGFAV